MNFKDKPFPRLPAPWEGTALVFVQLVLLLVITMVLSFVSLSLGLTDSQTIYSLFVGEVALSLPLLAWVWVRDFHWRETLNLFGASGRVLGLSVLLGVLLWPVASAITIPFEWLMSLIGPSPDLPTPQTLGQTITFAALLTVIAPLVEEPMFRGFVMRGWLPLGAGWAIAASGVLFGMLHGQLAQLVGLSLVGGLLGYVSLRSGSIVPGMIIHGVFNAISFAFLMFEAQLAWFSDWHVSLAAALAIPLLALVLWTFHQTARPRSMAAAGWPDTRGIILLAVSAVLVVSMFGVMGVLDILSRMMSVG